MTEHSDKFINEVIRLVGTIGLALRPEAAALLDEYYSLEEPAPLAAAMLAAQHAANDYLARDPMRMVRSADTALRALKMLKSELSDNTIDEDDWQTGHTFLSPFLSPSEITSRKAHYILSDMGDGELSQIIRGMSEAEIRAQKIVDDAYDQYLASYPGSEK